LKELFVLVCVWRAQL